ncbi:glyoxalase [Paenibacillus chitinolyticus]|nr:glyoxalase [Paenibacillus chitinolyticus]
MIVYEMTVQIRVPDFKSGRQWYEALLDRTADFIPHEGFAEWELMPGCWLQVAEGPVAEGSGPLRLGVQDLEVERLRLSEALGTELFEIRTREEIPVKWATFADPWGNAIGFFEYLDETEKQEKIRMIRAGKCRT